MVMKQYRRTFSSGLAGVLSMATLLAGCTHPGLQNAELGPPDLVKNKIERHYAKYASEERGFCSRPYIDTITKVDIRENTSERWVAEIRYHYLDRLRDEDTGSNRKICRGFASRTFTLASVNGDLAVVDMSGTGCAGSFFSLNRVLGLEKNERFCS